jgi:two-component system OmpR family sensor kinase
VVVTATRDDQQVVLQVTDHGPGVPAAFRGRLFERFSRDRLAAREHQGTGLGLAIVMARAEANGGSLHHRETPGGGATFILRLPAAP